MKRITNIRTLATLLMASAAIVSCSVKEDIFEEETSIKEEPAKVYTLSVNATKGGDDEATKALSLDGKTLNATWATTENVYVKKGETWATGSLKPQTDGTTATLKGTLSGITIEANNELTLQFPRSGALDYTGQVGTLADIAAKYDYATATVTVANVSATGNINPTEATTTFENQQAIVKFTLIDKADGTTPLNATQLTVSDGTTDYTVTPASATSEIYVALPGFSGQTVTLTATVGSGTYTYEKANVTFTNGKYYEITVKMTAVYKLLSAATAEDIGKVVCAAGHLHTAKTAVPAGCTAVGILGKVTETGRGLILALKDATSQDWNTINGWTSVTSYAGTTLKVLPNDAARGTNLKSYTALGATAVSNWAVAQKSDYEAIFTNLGSTTGNSEGTTYDGNVNAYITTGVGGAAISGSYLSATEYDDGKAWAFVSAFWGNSEKTNSLSVRPVLGFGAAKPLSVATADDYGMVVCAAGHLHPAKTAVPDGCTAVGILGKVSSTGHGLILALEDATSQTWNTINGWSSVTTFAGTTLKQLPNEALGSLTSYTLLMPSLSDLISVSSWCVAQKSDYEAIFTNLGSTTCGKDGCYTYDSNVNAYITTGVGGTALDDSYWSATEDASLTARFFYSDWWSENLKTYSYNVRPVLGF